VGIEKQAQNLAKMQGVQVRLYKIIYEIVDDIKKAVKGMLKPKEKEVIVGTARILKIFKLSVGKVLGCVIEKGKVQLGLNARIKRNGDVIHEGKIISLKKFKDSVVEVKEGEECGILIEGLQDAREQDLLECYNIIKEEIKID
jgi:translation initiation factor IF-2